MKPDPDELLLAEMIAAANAIGMQGCSGAVFRDAQYLPLSGSNSAAYCCALGAMVLANRADPKDSAEAVPHRKRIDAYSVSEGNDNDLDWSPSSADRGESIGWAFKQAIKP